MYNKSWPKWIRASVIKYFSDLMVANSIPFFVEGTDTKQTDEAKYVEIRVDGPRGHERTKGDHLLMVEINLLIQVIIDPTVNLYEYDELLGICTAGYVSNIPVYKYGSSVEDDQTQVGCLIRMDEKPRDHVVISDFGQIEPEARLRQATVEAHYKIELEG